MTKKIVAIWAEDENHLIGVNDGLPWRLPKELKHFKETTMGQALLMGRVTFDGMKRRILPGRETLILTRDKAFEADGVTVVNDMDQVFEWFKNHDKTLYVVGGASIYKAFLPYCDEIIKTTVHGEFDGDTYFPDVDLEQFTKVSESFYEKDDKNAYDFTITVFKK
ncbi:dihydrofolate reductase [Streptococcus equinus]|uniref:Dihydrofolate reductase n=1 Tax=Streptococcus equinus TaxID=1335 RepID=A0A239R957_STREI|nr:dihydrofolate reductase [Streptococcus equinus]QMS95635.1 dihydrofolate reductase [Streptococcus equinus]SEK31982.1 dihydrofolate reductase [Streptococcus equinus]SNU07332.1 dihydrofolate reductase [Streptococcus equinus]